MIKIPQVFFWKFYSRGKLTCAKTFCFVISPKECICNTQFYGLLTPTVHSFMLSLKNPKLTEQLFSEKKAFPLMKVLLILKISRGKVTNFSEVTKYFPTKIFPNYFCANKVLSIMVKSRYWNSNFGHFEGAKVQNVLRTVSLDPHGRLYKFKDYNSSVNLPKNKQNSNSVMSKKEVQI